MALTPKQEAVCRAYIENGGNRAQAYKTAYDADNMSDEAIYVEACRLFKSPNIALRVLELQEALRERHFVSIDSITMELDEARDLAKEEKQPSAMTGAIMGKAKIHGLVTDKSEVTGSFNVNMPSEDAETL